MDRRRLHLFRRVHTLFRYFPGLVLLLDSDCRIRFANSYFRERFGEPETRPLDEIFRRPEGAGDRWPFDREIAPRKWEGIMPDGRQYSLCALPFMEDDGSSLMLVLGIRIAGRQYTDQALRNVSEVLEKRIEERAAELFSANEVLREEVAIRRQVEEDLRRARAADDAERRRLAESVAFYRDIAHALPAAAVAYDPDGRVEFWNAAAETIFGWRADDVLGQSDPTVPGEETEAFRSLLDRIMGGEAVSGIRVRRRRKDGTPVALLLSAAPVRDASSRICGCAAVLTFAAPGPPGAARRPSRARRSRGG